MFLILGYQYVKSSKIKELEKEFYTYLVITIFFKGIV